mgnify:FL=1
MITAKQIDRLEQCYAYLDSISDELDGDQATCECCGRDSWSNLTEGRLAQEVEVMKRKTSKCISHIKNRLDDENKEG